MRISPSLFSIRWLRAVDIPSRKPLIYGYEPNVKPREFEAFSSKDSERIEKVWQQRKRLSNQNDSANKIVVEEDGLLCVDLNTMSCSPTYWDGPAFKVHRSLWFEMSGNNRISPVEPKIEAKIESYWANKVGSFEIDIRGPEGKQTMIADIQGDKVVLRERDSWLSAFRRRYLFRGLPIEDEMKGSRTGETQGDKEGVNSSSHIADKARKINHKGSRPSKSSSTNSSSKRQVKIRPEYKPRKINHLVFCVHGIGQLLSVKFEQVNFIKDVDCLRQMIEKSHISSSKDDIQSLQKKELENNTPTRTNQIMHNNTKHNEKSDPDADVSSVQVLPVLWRHNLHNKINGLEPSQLFGSANLAAEAVLDFVMYGSAHQKGNIQRIAGTEMRRMFSEFCKYHPEFADNPRVSIIGHSLGAVISFDIVCRSDFDLGFEVQNLFTLGSPLGVSALIEGDKLANTNIRAKSSYNIMRLSDPVATRLEPSVSPKFVEFGPRPMPGGGTNLLQQARELTGDLVSQGEFLASKASNLFQIISTNKTTEPKLKVSTKTASSEDHIPELQKFNRHGRLDFSVQETLDISLISGLAGHLMYLDNPDVVMFILREILRK